MEKQVEENKMNGDKVIVKAHTNVVFTFEEEGHLTMIELRDRVKNLMLPTGGKIKDIKLQIVVEE
jgi:hypothetical protein